MTQTAAGNIIEITKFSLVTPAMHPRKRRSYRLIIFKINLLVRFAGAFSFDGERMAIDTALHKPRHLHGIG